MIEHDGWDTCNECIKDSYILLLQRNTFFFVSTGLTEALFLEHKGIYRECERASMRQLYKAKVYAAPFIRSLFVLIFLSLYHHYIMDSI